MKNRKRPPLADIDDSVARKRSNHNRLTLMKMAHATRTFWTQAEALEFIAERQRNEKNINSVNKLKKEFFFIRFSFSLG